MRSPCPTNPPRVKTDASHLGIRLSEAGSASADGHASVGLSPSVGIAFPLLGGSLFAQRSCTHHCSTVVRSRISNTPQTEARIDHTASIVRRAWVSPPSPRATNWVRFDPFGPILDPWGSSPVDGSGLGFLHLLARCRSFSQQRIIPHQPSAIDSRLIDPRPRSMTASITPFRASQPESRGFTQPSTVCVRTPLPTSKNPTHSLWRGGLRGVLPSAAPALCI